MIVGEEIAEVTHGSRHILRLRQHYDTEVVGILPAEPSAGNNHDVLCMEEIHCELLIVRYVEFFYVELRENIECGVVLNI